MTETATGAPVPAKEVTQTVAVAPQATTQSALAATVPLDDFCRDFSINDRRVELIAGFHMQMKRDGKHRATADEYRLLFDEFVNAPA